jgi:hypothetical protein
MLTQCGERSKKAKQFAEHALNVSIKMKELD